jgi:hypothetical protein
VGILKGRIQGIRSGATAASQIQVQVDDQASAKNTREESIRTSQRLSQYRRHQIIEGGNEIATSGIEIGSDCTNVEGEVDGDSGDIDNRVRV